MSSQMTSRRAGIEATPARRSPCSSSSTMPRSICSWLLISRGVCWRDVLMTSRTACILRLCSCRSDIQPYFNCNFISWNSAIIRRMSSPQPTHRSTPLLVSKNILIRDSIFKRLHLQNDYSCPDKAKDSQMYQHLERTVEAAQLQHRAFMHALQEKIATADAHLHTQKASLHQKKIDLWELRSEVMQLQEMIEQQESEGEHEEGPEEGLEEGEGEEDEYEEGEAQIIESDAEGNSGEEGAVLELDELLARWGVQRVGTLQ